MNKRILRVLIENKSFYISAVLLIALVTAVYISFVSSGISEKNSIASFRNDFNVEDAQFITGLPLENIETIEKEHNVVIEEMRSKEVNSENNVDVKLLDISSKLNKYQIVEGNDIKDDQDILLNSFYAYKNGTQIGDKFSLEGTQFTICGFFTRPDYIYTLKNITDLIPNTDTYTTAIASKSAFEKFNKPMESYYSIKLLDQTSLDFRKNNSEQLKIVSWIDKEDNSRITTIDSDINSFKMIGYVAPIFAVIVACCFVSVVLGRLLKNDLAQAGTLYALGFRRRELLVHYMSYPIILCTLGILIGIIAGAILLPYLDVFLKVQYAVPNIDHHIETDTIVVAVLLPVVSLLLTSYYVVNKALKLPPLVLMRGGAQKVRIGYFERFIKSTRMSFSKRFKIKEILRNIPRTLLVIVGVAFSSMLMLFGFVIMDSIDQAVKDPMESFSYQYAYSLKMPVKDLPEGSEGFMRGLYEVADKESHGEGFSIWGVKPDTQMLSIHDEQGQKLSMDSVIVSKPLMNKLDIKLGDSIKIRNKLTLKEYTLKVDECSDINVGQYIYMPIESYKSMLGMDTTMYSGVFSMKEVKELNQNNILSVIKSEEFADGIETMMSPIRGLLYILGILAAIIGLLILYVVISMLIEENRSNISLFKVLGYYKKDIDSLIINSTDVLVLIGFILSIPLVMGVSQLMMNAITETMSFYIYVVLKPISISIGFVLIWLTFMASKIMSRKKTAAISMVESLKARE